MLDVLLVTAAFVAVACGGSVWWLRRRFIVVTVDGSSMEPAYRHGDRLLVRRVPLAAVRVGDVVVIEGSGRPGRLIKRVAAKPGERVPIAVAAFRHWPPDTRVPAGQLVVLGDNSATSIDSRQHGFFPAEQLLGVVIRSLRA